MSRAHIPPRPRIFKFILRLYCRPALFSYLGLLNTELILLVPYAVMRGDALAVTLSWKCPSCSAYWKRNRSGRAAGRAVRGRCRIAYLVGNRRDGAVGRGEEEREAGLYAVSVEKLDIPTVSLWHTSFQNVKSLLYFPSSLVSAAFSAYQGHLPVMWLKIAASRSSRTYVQVLLETCGAAGLGVAGPYSSSLASLLLQHGTFMFSLIGRQKRR